MQSAQTSSSTLDESFVLGGAGGDSGNSNFGSLSGTLLANHNYRFSWNALIAAASGGDAGASASGHITLALGDALDVASPVPEPTSVAMWSVMGGLGLLALRRRRNQSTIVG